MSTKYILCYLEIILKGARRTQDLYGLEQGNAKTKAILHIGIQNQDFRTGNRTGLHDTCCLGNWYKCEKYQTMEETT